LVAGLGLGGGLVPVRLEEICVLDQRYSVARALALPLNWSGNIHHLHNESNRNATPQTLEPPVEAKGQGERDWQRNDVVGDEVGRPANRLLADAA